MTGVGGVAKQFALIVVATVVATLISEYLVNNVRPLRRAIGS